MALLRAHRQHQRADRVRSAREGSYRCGNRPRGHRPRCRPRGLSIVGGYDFISDTFVSRDGNGRDSDARDPGGLERRRRVWRGLVREQLELAKSMALMFPGTVAARTNNGGGAAGGGLGNARVASGALCSAGAAAIRRTSLMDWSGRRAGAVPGVLRIRIRRESQISRWVEAGHAERPCRTPSSPLERGRGGGRGCGKRAAERRQFESCQLLRESSWSLR